jgi:hypothetical protein
VLILSLSQDGAQLFHCFPKEISSTDASSMSQVELTATEKDTTVTSVGDEP